ncbi:hypothetical protein N0V93_007955 [Gnomoniopsis smithogilvyi]|uniref:Uncharacterized protein n=1 Tax=Gnomoniopsis smithogilvyi TaxID=1191159 RepID=A0A9W9CUF1_9PEZI|nr:hypothetical protein N0V93_007955 [Gnomoniopsis smithogilvyi]
MKAVHPDTGCIVGYVRWILPADYDAVWPEAITPAVNEDDEAFYRRLASMADWSITPDTPDEPISPTKKIENEILSQKTCIRQTCIILDQLWAGLSLDSRKISRIVDVLHRHVRFGPMACARAAKNGGPTAVRMLPVSVVPRAKTTAISVEPFLTSRRSFYVSITKLPKARVCALEGRSLDDDIAGETGAA